LSTRDSDHEPSASPEETPAVTEPSWTTSSLAAEFEQRLAELLPMVEDAQSRILTVGEQQAVANLIQSLRQLLGADDEL
jgi:hypothetical protein